VGFGGTLPEALHEGFSTAMGQSILLPAAVILLGAAVALFFAKPKPVQGWGAPGPAASGADAAAGASTAAGADAAAGASTAAGADAAHAIHADADTADAERR
jgi:hypothetical protein